ncbi:winged helix-turn-helix domain-containing protein, partial [Pseudomonas aeruginosa]|nr:winged helix-turn-helix domain-containing protein [Pseudomonas aeruginosa]
MKKQHNYTVMHWGTWQVESREGEIVAVKPVPWDKNPSRIGQSLPDAVTSQTRIRRPAVRAGYLQHGPASREGRGKEPFVEVSWEVALDLLARELREQADVALMFLTGRDNEVDKILGLEIGADDYITKPFNPRELTIRARNLLSRTMNLGTVSEERRSVESYKFNGWELDINSRSLVSPNGEQYKLPRSEFRAMLHFCENPGKIQSRAELLKKMTGRELKPHDRTVDVTIRR